MPSSQFAQPFRILEIEKITDHFSFLNGVSEWHSDLNFSPGQYMMLDGLVNGSYLRRSYCPIKNDDNSIGILIKRNPDGIFSSDLLNKSENEIIRISAPVGKQKIFESHELPVFVFAFDSGISFAKSLTSWGVKNISRIFWLDISVDQNEMKSVIGELNFSESVECFNDRNTFIEKIHPILLIQSGIYLAGNGQYITFMNEILRKYQIPESRIHREIFYNHKAEIPDDWKIGVL